MKSSPAWRPSASGKRIESDNHGIGGHLRRPLRRSNFLDPFRPVRSGDQHRRAATRPETSLPKPLVMALRSSGEKGGSHLVSVRRSPGNGPSHAEFPQKFCRLSSFKFHRGCGIGGHRSRGEESMRAFPATSSRVAAKKQSSNPLGRSRNESHGISETRNRGGFERKAQRAKWWDRGVAKHPGGKPGLRARAQRIGTMWICLRWYNPTKRRWFRGERPLRASRPERRPPVFAGTFIDVGLKFCPTAVREILPPGRFPSFFFTPGTTHADFFSPLQPARSTGEPPPPLFCRPGANHIRPYPLPV